jgi:hypothetical protein
VIQPRTMSVWQFLALRDLEPLIRYVASPGAQARRALHKISAGKLAYTSQAFHCPNSSSDAHCIDLAAQDRTISQDSLPVYLSTCSIITVNGITIGPGIPAIESMVSAEIVRVKLDAKPSVCVMSQDICRSGLLSRMIRQCKQSLFEKALQDLFVITRLIGSILLP